ncbi:hypothetical protein V8E36_001120 [Tilletia maclaganii]
MSPQQEDVDQFPTDEEFYEEWLAGVRRGERQSIQRRVEARTHGRVHPRWMCSLLDMTLAERMVDFFDWYKAQYDRQVRERGSWATDDDKVYELLKELIDHGHYTLPDIDEDMRKNRESGKFLLNPIVCAHHLPHPYKFDREGKPITPQVFRTERAYSAPDFFQDESSSAARVRKNSSRADDTGIDCTRGATAASVADDVVTEAITGEETDDESLPDITTVIAQSPCPPPKTKTRAREQAKPLEPSFMVQTKFGPRADFTSDAWYEHLFNTGLETRPSPRNRTGTRTRHGNLEITVASARVPALPFALRTHPLMSDDTGADGVAGRTSPDGVIQRTSPSVGLAALVGPESTASSIETGAGRSATNAESLIDEHSADVNAGDVLVESSANSSGVSERSGGPSTTSHVGAGPSRKRSRSTSSVTRLTSDFGLRYSLRHFGRNPSAMSHHF